MVNDRFETRINCKIVGVNCFVDLRHKKSDRCHAPCHVEFLSMMMVVDDELLLLSIPP